jgi:hypothetical protein
MQKMEQDSKFWAAFSVESVNVAQGKNASGDPPLYIVEITA